MTTEERLTQLERRNRWLTAALVLAGIAGVLAGCVAAIPGSGESEPQECVTARRFLLVDADGKHRAELSAIKDGPALALFDENDKERIILSAWKDGPLLVLSDENGRVLGGLP